MLLIQTIPIRVNAVDVIYAAMPAYIYLWPDLLRLLLEPLLEYQVSPSYTNEYAAQDIGASEPEIYRAQIGNLGHSRQLLS